MIGGPDLQAGRSNKADSQGQCAILGGQLGDLPLPRLYTDQSQVPCTSHKTAGICVHQRGRAQTKEV